MDYSFFSELAPLYKTYMEVIKPLIAEIEVEYEKFPTPILNEIRAFNDHISRCYINNNDEQYISGQVNKAKGHIDRIILDCFKFLNISYHKKVIKKFDKKTRNIDLGTINNGDFLIKYKDLKYYINTNLKNAKKLESAEPKNESIRLYEEVHNKFIVLKELIDKNDIYIRRSRALYSTKRILRFIGWLGAALISGIISSSIIPWDSIWLWINQLFD